MMIHGYPKLRNMKQTAEETKQALAFRWSYLHCNRAGVLGGLFLIIGLIVPIIGLFFAIFMFANVIMKKIKMNAVHCYYY